MPAIPGLLCTRCGNENYGPDDEQTRWSDCHCPLCGAEPFDARCEHPWACQGAELVTSYKIVQDDE